VAVRELEAGRRDAVPQCTQHARLAEASTVGGLASQVLMSSA
jgi:hypothetical protein